MAKVIDNTHGERILRQEAAVPVIELLLRDSGQLDRETPGLGLAAEADGRDVRLRERDAIMVFLLTEQRGDSRIFADYSGINVPLVAVCNVPPVAQCNVPPQKWLQ